MEKLPAGKPKGQGIANGFDGNILGWVLNLIGGRIGSMLADLAQAFLGLGGLFDGPLKLISDKSMQDAAYIFDLQSKTQKLEGIIGYGSWVASNNLFLPLNQGEPGKRTMSFDRQVGPSIGVSLITDSSQDNKKIQRLDSRGLWQVIAQTKSRRSSYGGNDKVYLDVVVRAPNGSEYYRKAVDALALVGLGGDGEATLQANVMFVVPEKNYTVHVELFSDKWRWFYGGSLHSGLTILKHSSEVENTGTVDPGAPPVAG